MSLSLEHIDACVPTTALKALSWGSRNLILQGQGPFLRVVDDESGDVVTQVRVFKRNNLHGFISLSEEQDDSDPKHVRFIIWGGQSLRVVDLRSDSNGGIKVSVSSSEFLAPDWVMSGCAAVKDQPDAAYLITANNSILCLKLTPSSESPGQSVINIYQLSTSVKSILCAADLVALSPTHVLIAAGTIFGEIIVWSCFMDASEITQNKAFGSIHHFFTGHDGTVFGVQISPMISSMTGGKPGRVLASCSDDRTVRIWDISDCEHKSAHDPSAYSTDGFDLRSTGFGATDGADSGTGTESCIAQAFGHAARIWSIGFRSNISQDSSKIGLVTRGEDATCIVWDLTWESSSQGTTKYELRKDFSSDAHLGKHIWSMDLCRRGDETVVYTGGADGALRNFKIDEVRPSPTPKKSIVKEKSAKTSCVQHFAFVAEDCLIMCNKASQLQIGNVSQGLDANITWEPLHTREDIGLISLITGIPDKGLALISDPRGKVWLYNHSLKSVSELIDLAGRPMELLVLQQRDIDLGAPTEKIFFVASYAKDDFATLVTISEWSSDRPKVEATSIVLPQVPYDVASASLIGNGEYLLLGSRLGGLSVHPVGNPEVSTGPLLVDRRVHGHNGTNHIQTLSSVKASDSSDLEYVLTCGRDGKYCVHEVKIGKERGDAVTLTTVHRTESALGGNIEGAYFDELTGDLMMYGFKSQDFVLRNESKGTDITSIGSGGTRRPWGFQRRIKGGNGDLLVWREGPSLASQRIRHDVNCLVRAGGHGREIKAMDGLNGTNDAPPLIVTGAEDTTIRISTILDTPTTGPWGSVQTLRVLSTHDSGVQEASWSKCGKYLFTSAACEEFFIWRVRWIPSFGIATILAAVCPKDDPSSELRITSFDVVEVDEGEGSGFLLCLTLSNSTIKIFHYSPQNNDTFTLLARGKYMTNCLTQGRFIIQGSSVTLVTAATDGYFTLWDLTDTLKRFYTIGSSSLKAIGQFDPETSPEDITCENRHVAHSNSIKAMELVLLSDTRTMIVSGGDDNSLSISLLGTDPNQTADADTHVSTISIPDAHAASITAIKVLSQTHSKANDVGIETANIILASAGNDHRVKIWSITAPLSQSSRNIEAHFVQDRYSAVADISSMGLVRRSDSSVPSSEESYATLLVGGVGIELLKIKP
ncbi:uncharacterized protein N7503_009999 [Penicillium pulvis]|uniref:uncharacterized protein n=1 Tax=Penicillium pulvis TaxID=1562058 RepID=UPI002547943D|nr:uncharacterized protein N7503_009999 [Penicillium pulvis]KAJ5784787.1 hypothetical protein N7503_009999 [Penicillium pulvis]